MLGENLNLSLFISLTCIFRNESSLTGIEKLHKLYDVNYVWNMQRVFKIISRSAMSIK